MYLVLVLGEGRCAFRPPRVVFVLSLVSLIHSKIKTDCCSCAAMRGAMDGDVAAERQLNVVERLLVRMPRGRGFRVHTDAKTSGSRVKHSALCRRSQRRASTLQSSGTSPELLRVRTRRAAGREGDVILPTVVYCQDRETVSGYHPSRADARQISGGGSTLNRDQGNGRLAPAQDARGRGAKAVRYKCFQKTRAR